MSLPFVEQDPTFQLSEPSFYPLSDIDWDDILDASNNSAPVVARPESLAVFPPSPISTVSTLSPVQYPTQSFDEFFFPPIEESPIRVQNDVEQSIPPEYPSPTFSQSVEMATPIKEEVRSPESLMDRTSVTIPPRRRGPGRPSKAQLAAIGGHKPTGRSLITMRRQIHNDSAMRSRTKFNCMLDELWDVVPKAEREKSISPSDPARQICRAEKMEIVIEYLKKLQRSCKAQGKFVY
jgi:hypothetical protein